MSNIIEINLDDPGHLVDPPIIDTLNLDHRNNAWIATFVPEDSVSKREKETVTIAMNSSDGHRISVLANRLSSLIGINVQRITHSGGGNFAFGDTHGQVRELADERGTADLSMAAYSALSDISMTAQLAFISQAKAVAGYAA